MLVLVFSHETTETAWEEKEDRRVEYYEPRGTVVYTGLEEERVELSFSFHPEVCTRIEYNAFTTLKISWFVFFDLCSNL